MTETLRIDTPLVLESGGRLQALAGAIPPPPAAFSPPGADPLSTAIAGKVTEVVDPVIAQLPITKEELTRFAQNVLNAAGTYDSADRQLAEEILKRLEQFDSAAATGGAGSPGGGGAASAAGAPTSAAGTAASPAAAGAADQAGQLGQLMGMPMQLAQQAAQIPMQMMGMAAAIPQGIMQGVQGAMQQLGQVSDFAGTDEQTPEDEAAQAEGAEKRLEDGASEPVPNTDSRSDGAAPGESGGERAPEQQRQEAQPDSPPAPKPAPTRPAESSPEIAL